MEIVIKIFGISIALLAFTVLTLIAMYDDNDFDDDLDNMNH